MTKKEIKFALRSIMDVFSGAQTSIYKVSTAASKVAGLIHELDECEPCEPCEPEPDCCDDDSCYEDCDDDGYVWIYVPKDYSITLTPCE